MKKELQVLSNRIKEVVETSLRLDSPIKVNFSTYLSERLNYSYVYLSKTFSQVEKITLEQYLITRRIEYVKELLNTGEYTLTEIAHKLDYSSLAHISNQFKKITGITPTQYKLIRDNK